MNQIIAHSQPSQTPYYRSTQFLILFFILAWVMIPVQEAFAQKIASLEKVQGEVRVFKEGKKRGRRGRNGMALFAGQIIKTIGADSRTDVNYSKGAIVRVMHDSELTLAQADYDGGQFQIGINLAAGKVFNVVEKLTEGSKYSVQTRTGTSGVKGTIYSAETAAGGRTVFMVKEGKVEAASPAAPAQTVIVADLKKTVIEPQQAPSPPIPLTPEEIAMFDILDDIVGELAQDIMEDTREQIQEDLVVPGINEMP